MIWYSPTYTAENFSGLLASALSHCFFPLAFKSCNLSFMFSNYGHECIVFCGVTLFGFSQGARLWIAYFLNGRLFLYVISPEFNCLFIWKVLFLEEISNNQALNKICMISNQCHGENYNCHHYHCNGNNRCRYHCY